MLELRPTCENCNTALPPESPDAMICTYECTFCAACVRNILKNVCPNCAGGFTPRPIRPAKAWVENLSTKRDPPATEITHKPVNLEAHAKLITQLQHIAPESR